MSMMDQHGRWYTIYLIILFSLSRLIFFLKITIRLCVSTISNRAPPPPNNFQLSSSSYLIVFFIFITIFINHQHHTQKRKRKNCFLFSKTLKNWLIVKFERRYFRQIGGQGRSMEGGKRTSLIILFAFQTKRE